MVQRSKPEAEVTDVRPLTSRLMDKVYGQDARYEVTYQSSTSLFKRKHTVYAQNVIFSAGVMGTMKLLLNLRDVKKSLPKLSRETRSHGTDQLRGVAGKRGSQV